MVFFLNRYISKIIILCLIIISFYNIFSIFILSFSTEIEGKLIKTINYLPYKHTIFSQKPLIFSKKDMQTNSPKSQKFYSLINQTEKKSALDFSYWELKILHQINNKNFNADFEKNFINLALLSKHNNDRKKLLRIFYLRNIPRFSKEVGDIILAN